jgi:sugar phosphate isomerase/epimerase
MNQHPVSFSVFTKPWRMPLTDLAGFVRGLGFDGIELPVRPGYQVLPENVGRDLPAATRLLADHGLKIFSVAPPGGPLGEPFIAACAEAGVPVIRVMAPIGDDGYLASVARLQREYDALLPLLDGYGVKLGVQNHYGLTVCNAMGLRHLIERYDPRLIGAVWDAAHNALNGEDPEMAIDIVWSHLCMVNLKNAYWRRINGPEAEDTKWQPWWTTGSQGLASWPRVTAELKRRNYPGVICLTAEYSDESVVDRLIAQDIGYAKALFVGT